MPEDPIVPLEPFHHQHNQSTQLQLTKSPFSPSTIPLFPSPTTDLAEKPISVKQFKVRPPSSQPRTNRPYYKLHHALQMKSTLESMMKDEKNRVFRYEDFPSLKPSSLYLKISQSMQFVKDNLDPDGTLLKFWKNNVSIYPKEGVGYILLVRPSGTFVPDVVDMGEVSSVMDGPKKEETWKDKLDNFLDNGSVGIPFMITNLALSIEEQTELEIQLAGLAPHVVYSINSRQIKLTKIPT